MKQITLDVSDDMFEALHELSTITEQNAEGDRVGKLLESSIRIYEWMLYQQFRGRELVVINSSDLALLKEMRREEKRDFVLKLFPEDKKSLLEDYFSKAA